MRERIIMPIFVSYDHAMTVSCTPYEEVPPYHHRYYTFRIYDITVDCYKAGTYGV